MKQICDNKINLLCKMACIFYLELDVPKKFLNDTKNFFTNTVETTFIGLKILKQLVLEIQFDNDNSD